MPKFRVYGTVHINVTGTVEASSEDEAADKAYEEWPGLSNYAGNGGTNKIVGLYDQNWSIEPADDALEIDVVEKGDDDDDYK